MEGFHVVATTSMAFLPVPPPSPSPLAQEPDFTYDDLAAVIEQSDAFSNTLVSDAVTTEVEGIAEEVLPHDHQGIILV